ncbi:unnamed protein product [Adineta steineri]|uniref:Uncharacterized protein n=1 Tax=Adineta steineri TaxID=433720 RepID=A0A815WNK5_9BILA|nr:unnamed protein product [Adineta steineri]CAF1545732.1 unnamed protein product [Adineta steineri]
MLTTSTNMVCPACSTTVVSIADKIHYSRKTWHKICFRCKTCSIQLNSVNAKVKDDENYAVYCYRHYRDDDNVSVYSEISSVSSSFDTKYLRSSQSMRDAASNWTVEEVAKWLCDISLQPYVEVFRRNNIDGGILIDEIDGLDDEIVHQLIPSIGHQLKLRKALRLLRNKGQDRPQRPRSAIDIMPQRPHSAVDIMPQQDSDMHMKLLLTIQQQAEHISSLISTVTTQSRQIESLVTKMATHTKSSQPMDTFNKLSSVVKNQLLDLPSNVSKIPLASSNSPSSSVPTIDSVAPSVLTIPITLNVPTTTTSVPTSIDGPQGSNNVLFPAVIHPNIDGIAIKPVIEDKYNFQNYGNYTVTIYDQGSENVLVQTVVNVVPENEICMPKKFVLRDSVNNVLVGATVKLKLEGNIVFTGITDSTGTVIMPTTLQKNCYEVEIDTKDTKHKPSVFRMIVYENRGSDSNTQFICRKLDSDQLEIVLKWDKVPRDLDSHLFSSDGRHVFYDSKVQGNISLDYDVTGGYGPETVKLTLEPGLKYLYVVHRYSRDGLLTKSNATVTFNNGHMASTSTTPYQIVQIPVVNNPNANFWIVCEIDGTTKKITMFENEFETHNNYASNQVGAKYFNR